jgi:hypothetical protein
MGTLSDSFNRAPQDGMKDAVENGKEADGASALDDLPKFINR